MKRLSFPSILLSIIALSAILPAKQALAYNGNAAAAYADTWWNSFNARWITQPDDCTNFVSQALNAGGDSLVGAMAAHSDDDNRWYEINSGGWHWSNAFTVAGDLYHFLSNSGRGYLTGIYYPPANLEGPDNGVPGDVLLYAWGRDGNYNITHSSIQVAYGNDLTYPGWNGALIDQHTSPRHHEIWSLKPTNPDWATTYIYVIHHN